MVKKRYGIKDQMTGGRLLLNDWVEIIGGDFVGHHAQIKSFPSTQSVNVYIPDLKKTVKVSSKIIGFLRPG